MTTEIFERQTRVFANADLSEITFPPERHAAEVRRTAQWALSHGISFDEKQGLHGGAPSIEASTTTGGSTGVGSTTGTATYVDRGDTSQDYSTD